METQRIEIKKTVAKKIPERKLKRILLIDADKDSAVSTALAREGYGVVHCDSVQKAWSRVYPHRPQVIIFHRYDSHGIDLSDLQECRALAEGVPIILTTAHASRALSKAMQHGSAVVLAASSTPESVSEALHHLESAAMRR
jgi:DNA-binding NtrC family response regulator